MPIDTTEALTMASTTRTAEQILDELWRWLIAEEERLARRVKFHADMGDTLSEARMAGALSRVCCAIELLEAGY